MRLGYKFTVEYHGKIIWKSVGIWRCYNGVFLTHKAIELFFLCPRIECGRVSSVIEWMNEWSRKLRVLLRLWLSGKLTQVTGCWKRMRGRCCSLSLLNKIVCLMQSGVEVDWSDSFTSQRGRCNCRRLRLLAGCVFHVQTVPISCRRCVGEALEKCESAINVSLSVTQFHW